MPTRKIHSQNGSIEVRTIFSCTLPNNAPSCVLFFSAPNKNKQKPAAGMGPAGKGFKKKPFSRGSPFDQRMPKGARPDPNRKKPGIYFFFKSFFMT